MTSRTLARKIAGFAFSKKAHDVLALDVRKITSTTDFLVICSADSDTQVRSIADAVEQGSMEAGTKPWHTEGYQASTWIILDFVDVVVHVFHKEARTYYNLERLWSDAKVVQVEDEIEPRELPGKKRKPAAARHATHKKAGKP